MNAELNIVDIHSHILPGIDDGAKDWDMTMEMIQMSWERGVREIIATPHYLPWRPETTPEQIKMLCKETEERSQRDLGIAMKIHPGQEVFYHLDLLEHMKQDKIQTMNDTNYILVEFDTRISWHEFRYATQNLTRSNYRPIYAHYERYECLRSSDHMDELRKYPVKLQMNIRSLAGGIFDKEASWCRKQVKQGNVDFLASDMHNMSGRPPFDEKGLDWLNKKMMEASGRLLQDQARTCFQLL